MKIRKLDLANRKIIPLFPSLLFQDSSVNEFNEVKDGLIEYAYKQREEDNTNKSIKEIIDITEELISSMCNKIEPWELKKWKELASNDELVAKSNNLAATN